MGELVNLGLDLHEQNTNMVFCMNCGVKQLERANFCHECGHMVVVSGAAAREESKIEPPGPPPLHAHLVQPTAPPMMEAAVAIPMGGIGLRTKVVELSSHNFKPAHYNSVDGMIFSARILDLHSKAQPLLLEHRAPGDNGDKWGYSGYILYVKDGIRATFELTFVDKHEFQGYGGGKSEAILSEFSMLGNGTSRVMQVREGGRPGRRIGRRARAKRKQSTKKHTGCLPLVPRLSIARSMKSAMLPLASP